MIAHHDLCFGCGVGNVFGLHIEAEHSDGELRGRVFGKQDLMGPPGTLHGGVIATALDEAMSLLVYTELGPYPTARLETDFRAPVPLGTFVEVHARIVERDGRKVTCTAELRGESSAVLATGRAVFIAPR